MRHPARGLRRVEQGPHSWGCDREAGRGRGFDDGPVRGYGVGSPMGPLHRPPPRPRRGIDGQSNAAGRRNGLVGIDAIITESGGLMATYRDSSR